MRLCLLWMAVAITLTPAVLMAEEERVISELKKGNIEVVKSMIENGTPVDTKAKEGWEGSKGIGATLLVLTACGKPCGVSLTQEQQLTLLRFLINKGANLEAEPDAYEGEGTALAYAVFNPDEISKSEQETNGGVSRFAIVKLLLEHGAQANIASEVSSVDLTGRGGFSSTLVDAAAQGYYQVVALLLKYGAYQSIDYALELALNNHHDQTAKVLWQAITDLDQLRQGKNTWDLTDMEINGKKVSFKPLHYNFEEGELFTTNSIYKFRFDPTMTPMHLDVIGDNETFFGIYEVNENQLRIAYRFPSSPEGRPKDFTTNADSKLIAMTFRKLTPEIYLPLDEGRTWTYQFSTGNFLGIKGNEKMVMANFAKRELENRKVTPRKIDIGERTGFLFLAQDEQGIYEYAEQEPGEFKPKIKDSPAYFIKAPIKAGTRWDEQYTTESLQQNVSLPVTAVIESLDEVVTVPAGTFEQCLKVAKTGRTQKDKGIWGKEEVSVERYNWYAPGVGLVQSVIKEKGTTIMVGAAQEMMQLESFKK